MRSEWRRWPNEARRSWKVPGGTAYVVYPFLGEDYIEHDDGTWSPKEFTYVERPEDASLPTIAVECVHTDSDLLPRVVAVQVTQRDPARDVRTSDFRRLRLENAIEEAWRLASRRPVPVKADASSPESLLTAGATDEQLKRTARGLRHRARRKITPAIHDQVAAVYRAALDTGAPTKAVQAHFGIATSTASLYVKRARAAGRDLGDPVKTAGKAVTKKRSEA